MAARQETTKVACQKCIYCGADAFYQVTRSFRKGDPELGKPRVSADEYTTKTYYVCASCRSRVTSLIEVIVHPAK